MTNDLIPVFAALLMAALCAYVTFHERSVSDAGPLVSDSSWDGGSSAEPGPRDRCRCGHTYDWHHSCPRDVCGCREFAHAQPARATEAKAA